MDIFWLIWEWIVANKEWLFSGAGLSVVGFIYYMFRNKQGQTINIIQNTSDNATSNIHTGQGDIKIKCDNKN